MAALEGVGRPATAESAATEARSRRRRVRGIGTLIGAGFWATLISLVVSAAVAPGFLVFAFLPLAGAPYLLFCWIAWTAKPLD